MELRSRSEDLDANPSLTAEQEFEGVARHFGRDMRDQVSDRLAGRCSRHRPVCSALHGRHLSTRSRRRMCHVSIGLLRDRIGRRPRILALLSPTTVLYPPAGKYGHIDRLRNRADHLTEIWMSTGLYGSSSIPL